MMRILVVVVVLISTLFACEDEQLIEVRLFQVGIFRVSTYIARDRLPGQPRMLMDFVNHKQYDCDIIPIHPLIPHLSGYRPTITITLSSFALHDKS